MHRHWGPVLDARPPWHRIVSADAHESHLRSLFSSSCAYCPVTCSTQTNISIKLPAVTSSANSRSILPRPLPSAKQQR
eukprot:4025565-Pleurochrysis_carterae.AAC.1